MSISTSCKFCESGPCTEECTHIKDSTNDIRDRAKLLQLLEQTIPTNEELWSNGPKKIWADVHADERGYFSTHYRVDEYRSLLGDTQFVQDNVSVSGKRVFRGLHFQDARAPVGKLISVLRGDAVFFEVDIRKGSPTLGKWKWYRLSDDRPGQLLWVPPGWANGFLSLSPHTTVHYKCTSLWRPDCEVTINPFDPNLGIADCLGGYQDALMSAKDKESQGILFWLSHPQEHQYHWSE